MRIAILVVAGIMGGWLTFDGSRALLTGDYVTRNGQLGPWSRVVAAAGIEPRGQVMKIAHLVLGLAWLASLAAFALRSWGSSAAIAICAVLSLWYLPIGAVLGIAELALLVLAK